MLEGLSIQDFNESLNIIKLNFLEIINVILVGITTSMVYLSYKLYRRQIELSEAIFQPTLTVKLMKNELKNLNDFDKYFFKIKNNGVGLAQDIRLYVSWARWKTSAPHLNDQETKFTNDDYKNKEKIRVEPIPPKESINVWDDITKPEHNWQDFFGVRLVIKYKGLIDAPKPEYEGHFDFKFSEAEVVD